MSAVQEILDSEEWRCLESLRSFRDRLVNMTGYQQLDRSQLLLGRIGAQNDASLLEDGLRNVMRRNDLDTLFDHGLDVDAQAKASASLNSLCATLESITTTDLGIEARPEQESKYPKIDLLLQELGSTEWHFYMVSGSRERKLFVTTDFKTIKEQVDNFHTLFDRLTQPDLRDLELSNAQQGEKEQTSGSCDQTQNAIQTLQALFRWLTKLTTTTCSGCHNVLLQLPEWDMSSSRERFRKRHLDLYLSCCEESGWQESCLQELTDEKDMDWYPAQNLCDEIKGRNRERFTIGATKNEVYIYAGSIDDLNSLTTPSGRPSKTLKQLIQNGAFLGPDSWLKIQKFEPMEKRNLAASLVLSFLLTDGDTHLIKGWDPECIYFLSDSQGKCMRSLPYAMCLTSVANESTESRKLDVSECEARFALLARLLMEIECGISLEHIHINTTGHPNATDDTFGNFIYDEVTSDLSESKRSYLKAVRMCLDFQQKCRMECMLMERRGHQGGQAIATRRLIHDIVRNIQKSVENWPSVSPQPEQFGMSNGSLALWQTPVVPNILSEVVVQNRPQVGTQKQVRFVGEGSEEESEGEKDETTIPGVLKESQVVTTDYCELFGDMDAQEYPEALCKVAKRWIREFKKLWPKPTAVQNEQRIKVAVLDTGVDINHLDIKGNVHSHKSFIDGDSGKDHSGHGTHIAGIILGLTTNVDLYIGQVIDSRKSDDRRPIIEALIHAREVWKVDMISLSFGFRLSHGPDLVQEQIKSCLGVGITVFASGSNDAGNKPRTYPGAYDGVLCIHSATGAGNASSFNPSPISGVKNFSFVGDCVKSSWPMDRRGHDGKQGDKYLSGTSIATPVAVAVAVFMINYIRTEFPGYHWNTKPWSPEGIREIFTLMAHSREGYDWVSPEWFLTGDHNHKELRKAQLKSALRAYIPQSDT
ncbi:hypothetical protein Q7P35_002234 [Cladosporium inversicolor]